MTAPTPICGLCDEPATIITKGGTSLCQLHADSVQATVELTQSLGIAPRLIRERPFHERLEEELRSMQPLNPLTGDHLTMHINAPCAGRVGTPDDHWGFGFSLRARIADHSEVEWDHQNASFPDTPEGRAALEDAIIEALSRLTKRETS